MALFNVFDVICISNGTMVNPGEALNVSGATVIDPVVLDTDADANGNPFIYNQTSGQPSTFNGSEVVSAGSFEGNALLCDGTKPYIPLNGTWIETADGNLYIALEDGVKAIDLAGIDIDVVTEGEQVPMGDVEKDEKIEVCPGNPPCFTPGALIDTDRGPIPIESLKSGDMILTRDNGYQPLMWRYSTNIAAGWFALKPDLRPVHVTKDAFGPGVPSQDMKVSPGHLMLLTCGTEEFVPAKYLTQRTGIYRARDEATTYIHLLFENHQVVRVNGLWSESFQPGLRSLSFMEQQSRNEVLYLIPELRTYEGLDAYTAARPVLRGAAGVNRLTSIGALPLQ